jgi:hypothetical protein
MGCGNSSSSKVCMSDHLILNRNTIRFFNNHHLARWYTHAEWQHNFDDNSAETLQVFCLYTCTRKKPIRK